MFRYLSKYIHEKLKDRYQKGGRGSRQGMGQVVVALGNL